MISPVNERSCPRCRTLYIGADVLCPACRRARDRWRETNAEVRRLEEERNLGGPLRIIDLSRSRTAASAGRPLP